MWIVVNRLHVLRFAVAFSHFIVFAFAFLLDAHVAAFFFFWENLENFCTLSLAKYSMNREKADDSDSAQAVKHE